VFSASLVNVWFIILMNCFLCVAGFVSPGSGVAQVGVFV
jgi:hypothetical protein